MTAGSAEDCQPRWWERGNRVAGLLAGRDGTPEKKTAFIRINCVMGPVQFNRKVEPRVTYTSICSAWPCGKCSWKRKKKLSQGNKLVTNERHTVIDLIQMNLSFVSLSKLRRTEMTNRE